MTMQRDSYKSVANSHNTIMQRRHFELIAETMADCKPGGGISDFAARYYQWQGTCEAIARKLQTTNPNFNRDRFLRACGVE